MDQKRAMTHQDRRLHAPAAPRLQPRPAWRRGPEPGRRPPTRHGALIRAAPALPALDDHAEHTMTAAAALVPVRAGRAPVALAAMQHFAHRLQARDDLLAERRENHVIARALDLHRLRDGGGRRREEVVDSLVVDFEVRAPQEVLARRRAPDAREDVLHRARDDTWLVFVATLHVYAQICA